MLGGGKFSGDSLQGGYRAIRERRDVRSEFLPEPLQEEVLFRLLAAAHQAPSVDLTQPWRFILIRSLENRRAVHDIFLRANQAALASYAEERAQQYADLNLEGILNAPQNLCVVCDTDSEQGHRLGRSTTPETAVYSAVCAVRNLCLAGGWVSVGSAFWRKTLFATFYISLPMWFQNSHVGYLWAQAS